MAKARDYKREYREYHGKPEQIKRRAGRNAARTLLTKRLGASAVKGKDVDHKDRNTRNNSPSNLRLMSVKKNRGRNN
jgi:hypothetical protein